MTDTALDEGQAATLSRHVRAMITEAATAFDRSDDEAAWYSIVEKVLAFEIDAKVPDDPFISPPHPHFIITNTQSKHIHRHLFPDIPARHQSKTVDYTLQFNHKNSKYQTFYTEYKTRSLQALSPFKDASVEYIIPVLMVEVKPPGGDYLEAQYQAALATIATVNHRRGVISQSRSSLLGSAQVDTLDLPTPFFTVVGHQ